MSCGACIKVTCAETSSLPKYLGGYSLSNGTFSQNAAPITITTNTPNGPTTITFPPGTIQISIPSPVPTTPFTFTATYKQCNASYTIEIPPTQSAAFFDQVIAALAQQLGDCLGESATPGGGTTHQYVNSPQTISCPGGSQMLLCNPSLYFPQGITFNSSGNGSLSVIGGVVVATTLASANAGAIQLLQSFLTNMLNSQNMACGGPCPQTCSQALSGLVWTVTPDNISGGTSSGSVSLSGPDTNFNFSGNSGSDPNGQFNQVFTASITNSNNTPCVYNVTLPSVTPGGTTGNSVTEVNFPDTASNANPSNFCSYVYGAAFGVLFNRFPGTLTIPANSTVNLTLSIGGNSDTVEPSAISLTGMVTISPA